MYMSCRLTASKCAASRPTKSSAGRRCGYAFSYDENCGRLVAESMQVFTSTESLDHQSATAAAVDVDYVWHSASDVSVTVPRSRCLEILTE